MSYIYLYHFSDDSNTERGFTSRSHLPLLKKRKLKPEKWKKNIIKAKRNAGEAYISLGISRPAKCIREPCPDYCRMKCREHVSDEQRQVIFNHYWGLSDLRSKRQYVAYSLDIPTNQCPRDTSKGRGKSFRYHFRLDDGRRVPVCKMFYQNTLNISNRAIKTAVEKLTDAGNIEDDKRGKHKTGRQNRAESIE